MEQKTLVKMPLINSPKDRLQKLVRSQTGFYVASNHSLFQVDLNPRKIVRYDHPHHKKGKTLDLYRQDESIWWIHQDGVIQIKAGQEKKPNAFVAAELHDAEHASFDSANQALWVNKGGRLGVIDFRHNPAKFTSVHQAKDAFIGVEATDDSVFAHTNFAVLRFDATHRTLAQIIPVEDKKKLLAMDIERDQHAYLFNDTLYEFFNIATRTHFQTRLPLPAKARVERLRHEGNKTVVLLEDKIAGYIHRTPLLRLGDKEARPAKKG